MLVDFFFFKKKTAYEMRISDWSSDVCSSDLSNCDASAQLDCLQPGAALLKLGGERGDPVGGGGKSRIKRFDTGLRGRSDRISRIAKHAELLVEERKSVV